MFRICQANPVPPGANQKEEHRNHFEPMESKNAYLPMNSKVLHDKNAAAVATDKNTPAGTETKTKCGGNPVVVEYGVGPDPRPFLWVYATRSSLSQTSGGFVKKKWLVDTGARRSALSDKDAKTLKLGVTTGHVKVRTAVGCVRRKLVRLKVCTLPSGKPSEKDSITSTCELEVSVRAGEINHSILGMDWVLQVKPEFRYQSQA